MKETLKIILLLILPVLLIALYSCGMLTNQTAPVKQQKLNVVVVTGGHEFEHDPFFEIFDSIPDIHYVEANQSDDSEIFEDITGWDYDVIVLYNMTQNISPKRQDNFITLLNDGVGLVALHHSLGSFQQWPEYRKIIGAKYYLEPTQENGIKYPAGQFIHDLDISVHVEDPAHPVTKGIKDFTIHDETYSGWFFDSGNHLLLTTNHPSSNTQLVWTRNYDNARICYIQLGHDSKAYSNQNYRRLVAQAIRWCSGEEN